MAVVAHQVTIMTEPMVTQVVKLSSEQLSLLIAVAEVASVVVHNLPYKRVRIAQSERVELSIAVMVLQVV